jgi:hypothetical protein
VLFVVRMPGAGGFEPTIFEVLLGAGVVVYFPDYGRLGVHLRLFVYVRRVY